jgi:hypothetical protein
MGARGPIPKRSDQRRRTNSPASSTVTVTVPDYALAGQVSAWAVPDPEWHPVARRWFESLRASRQSVFYEPSDYAVAYLLAESMSRELSPQPMVVGKGADAHVEMVLLPPKGALIAVWLKGMTGLLATEGDRRRAGLELARRPDPATADDLAAVTWLEDASRRLRGSGGA